ncbi:hypothetical protein GCM10023223_10300 [Stackebrandtia albiflava]
MDGVINAPRPAWPGRIATADVAAAGVTYPLRWSVRLVDRIRDLATSGAVDVVWCSTWCPDAHLLEDLWRLPRLARAFTRRPTGHADMWKWAAVWENLSAGHRVVWTDDTEVPIDDADRDALHEQGEVLPIRPRSRAGLRPADLATIEAFVVAPSTGTHD